MVSLMTKVLLFKIFKIINSLTSENEDKNRKVVEELEE